MGRLVAWQGWQCMAHPPRIFPFLEVDKYVPGKTGGRSEHRGNALAAVYTRTLMPRPPRPASLPELIDHLNLPHSHTCFPCFLSPSRDPMPALPLSLLNPFSTMTCFHIHYSYYLVILYSFRSLCGD
ncbi:hypothetical protein E2C01_068887 [Portunus trituberculatus]|uniref:Uncharacterized protein n=1 Tax=Portunus trituberculatus TaxID=210409 RepID=A0A5B7HZ47_PORTR|nr:hypothetical protein [Portunus trituberculatus]